MQRSFLPVERLADEPYSGVLGYPRATRRQLRTRMRELEGLGVRSVSFTGDLKLGSLSILGKGYAGLVVLAVTERGVAALKIRRMDSPRASLQKEADLLKAANRTGVGPDLYASSRNFLAMKFLDGEGIGRWVQNLSGRGSAAALKQTILQILKDCFLLDAAGLDHGELSSISKHVIVTESGATLIDFESASTKRRVSNVTSAAQGIFIGSAISRGVYRIYRAPARDVIIGSLREYKRERTGKSFDSLVSVLKL